MALGKVSVRSRGAWARKLKSAGNYLILQPSTCRRCNWHMAPNYSPCQSLGLPTRRKLGDAASSSAMRSNTAQSAVS